MLCVALPIILVPAACVAASSAPSAALVRPSGAAAPASVIVRLLGLIDNFLKTFVVQFDATVFAKVDEPLDVRADLVHHQLVAMPVPHCNRVSIIFRTKYKAQHLVGGRELLANHCQQQVLPVLGRVRLRHSERKAAALFAGRVFPQGLDSIDEDVEHRADGHHVGSAQMSLHLPKAAKRLEFRNHLVLRNVFLFVVGLRRLSLYHRPDLVLGMQRRIEGQNLPLLVVESHVLMLVGCRVVFSLLHHY